MDDATRTTWAGVLLTMGLTTGLAFLLRWAATPDESRPELWILGPLALGFLIAAAQLWVPVRTRRLRATETERERRAAGGDYWGGEA